MAECPRCGKQNLEDARFCSACGSPLADRSGSEVRKVVTLVFSDLVGSTALGERLDPETLRRIVLSYFERMCEVLERHGGTVEKFIGDAVMAVFGVPASHEDDALRAVRAAAEMREALAAYNEELQKTYGLGLQARTGVATGEVMAGDPSAGQAFVSGDTVNLAARLEQAAAPGEIILGDETLKLVREAVTVEKVEPLSLKGKAEPVPAWRLLAVAPLAPGLSRRLDAPLVGRMEELAHLHKAFDRSVAERRCQTVTILGAAGAGKTRLAAEFTSAVREHARILRGRCLPYGEGITFWPLAEVLKEAAGIEDSDSPEQARGRISAIVPAGEDASLIAGRLAGATGLGDAGGESHEIFWATRRLLESLSAERPLVVVFEDIHWAEATFLDLLEYLSGFRVRSPLMLLCIARPDLIEVRPTWNTPHPDASSILLEPLTDLESGELIAQMLGTAEVPEEVRRRIAHAAQGNPLFAEEMLGMLLEKGLLHRRNGGWVATSELEALPVPPSIQALLAARLDGLENEERAVIGFASVVGEVFWWGAVAHLAPERARSSVGGHLQSLVRKGLVFPQEESFAGEDAFAFRHILIRDAAYSGLPKERRADLHERFADWLKDKAGERIGEFEEILGYHLEQAALYAGQLGIEADRLASLRSRAADALASAGRRALSQEDYPAARSLMARAAGLLDERDPARLELLVSLGRDVLIETDIDQAIARLAEARELAEATGDLRWATRARVGLLELQAATGAITFEASLEESASAIEVLERLNDHAGLARAWRNRSSHAHGLCRAAEAAHDVLEAAHHARIAGDIRLERRSLVDLAHAELMGPTPVVDALKTCAEIGAKVGPGNAGLLWVSAGLQAMCGDFELARRLYEQSSTICRERGMALAAASNPQHFEHWLKTDATTAERELRSSCEALKALGETSYLSTSLALLAHAVHARGDLDEVEQLADESRGFAVDDDIYTQVLWRTAQAKVDARRGRAESAEKLAREAIALAQRGDWVNLQADALMALAEVLRLLERTDEAREPAFQALDLYEKKGNVVSTRYAQRFLEEL